MTADMQGRTKEQQDETAACFAWCSIALAIIAALGAIYALGNG